MRLIMSLLAFFFAISLAVLLILFIFNAQDETSDPLTSPPSAAPGLASQNESPTPPSPTPLPTPAPRPAPVLTSKTQDEATSGTETLSVRIIWEDSKRPIPGTSVTLTATIGMQWPKDVPDTPGKSLYQVTDSNGLTTFRYPSTWLLQGRLTAVGPGTARNIKFQKLPCEKQPIEIEMGKALTVSGKVLTRNAEGKLVPVAGANVFLWGVVFPVTTSAADGSYELGPIAKTGSIAKKSYTLDARKGSLRVITHTQEATPFKFDSRHGPYDLILKPTLTLSGVVTSKETGDPITSATVKLNVDKEYKETTDMDGLFSIECLPQGRFKTTAQAAGFSNLSHLIQLTPAKDNMAIFELESGGELLLLVTDKEGTPIPYANAYISTNYSGGSSKRTDEEGRANFKGISLMQPQNISVSKKGYQRPGQKSIEFTAGSMKAEMTIVMEPTEEKTAEKKEKRVFIGKVTNKDGEGLAEVNILWCSEWEAQSERGMKTQTAEDGSYRLEVWNNQSRSQLCAYGAGIAPLTQTDLTPGPEEEPTEVNFTAEAGHWLTGTVVDEDDNPIQGVQISFRPVNPGGYNHYGLPGTKSKKTDAEGAFRVENLPAPEVSLQLTAKGMSRIEQKIVAVDKEARIVMTQTGIILGKVVDKETQEPIADFTVKIKGGNGLNYERTRTGEKIYDTDGLFTLDELSMGSRFEVTVESRFRAPMSLKGIVAGPAEDAEDNLFELSKAELLVGIILDEETKEPLANIPIVYGTQQNSSYMHVDWNRLGQSGMMQNVQRSRSDEEGAFSFNEGEAKGVLLIRSKGYSPLIITPDKREAYTEEGSEALKILLSKGASVAGVYYKKGEPVASESVHLNSNSASQNNTYQGFETKKTDAEGAYNWESLAEGTYSLAVYVQSGNTGTSAVSKKFELEKGEDKLVNLGDDMGTCVLFGRVLDGEIPVTGVNLRLSPSFDWEYSSFSDFSKKEGEYRIEGLRAGTYRVSLNKYGRNGTSAYPQQNNLTLEIKEGENEQDYQMRKGRKVTARLKYDESATDEFRSRRGSASLNLSGGSPNSKDPEAPQRYSNSQFSSGRLSFQGRLKGRYNLSLNWYSENNENVSYRIPEPFDIDNFEADQDLGEIEIPAMGISTLSGRVLDAKGNGVAGARISLASEFKWGYSPTATSDSAGRYSIANLRDGAYQASMRRPRQNGGFGGQQTSEKIEVAGDTTHDFIIETVNKITAQIEFAEGVPEATRSGFKNATIQTTNLDAMMLGPQEPNSPALHGSCQITGNKMTFEGKFIGEYKITLSYRSPTGANSQVAIPQTFQLDNTGGDRDLGAIVVPALGEIRLALQGLSSGSIPEQLALVLMPPGNPNSPTALSMTYKEGEQTLGPVAPGTYEVTLMAPAFASDPAKQTITIAPGQTPLVSFTIRPIGILFGYVGTQAGPASKINIRSVTLSGPGVSRILTPTPGATASPFGIWSGGKDFLAKSVFVFNNLPQGDYQFVIDAEGHEPYQGIQSVTPGQMGQPQPIQLVPKETP